MSAVNQVDSLFKRVLFPFLKKNAFIRKGAAFWRNNDKVFDLIDLQKSQWNSADCCEFYINMAVSWPALDVEFGVPLKIPPVTRHIDCRLGPDGIDSGSWLVKTDSNPFQIGDFVLEMLEKHGLPWLLKHHNPEPLLEYYKTIKATAGIKAVENYLAKHAHQSP